ncbi:MAG: D-glycerate dehydrogenase [Phycisphaeraceae bacterium]|nr:D-glycerate dehydrogenase [Phycisphaeraceae bacterium]
MKVSGQEEPLVVITRGVPVNEGEAGAGGVPVVRSVGGGRARVVMAAENPALSAERLRQFVRGAHVIVSMFHDRIDGSVLDAAGGQLRGVCNFAVGFDNIELGACRERGVVVCNCPDAVTEGTANLAWGLILASTRRLIAADRFVRSGEFSRKGNPGITEWLGTDLAGRNLLIVGAGRIGMAVALRGLGFGMRVLYAARKRHVEFEIGPVAGKWVELEEGLRQADVVSVHTPLTEQTRHLINAERIGMMKPTAVIVNTSRGAVIDEGALVAALRAGRIFGAGLDVFEHEPRVHAELAGLENVALTPHIGSAERKWREVMTQIVVSNAEAILARGAPPNRVA